MHNGKLMRKDYPDFDKLPRWQQEKIMKAILKRVRRESREGTLAMRIMEHSTP